MGIARNAQFTARITVACTRLREDRDVQRRRFTNKIVLVQPSLNWLCDLSHCIMLGARVIHNTLVVCENSSFIKWPGRIIESLTAHYNINSQSHNQEYSQQ
jgi:hypothetical protein